MGFYDNLPTNTVFPLVNACLNGTSALLLGIGFYLIMKRRWIAHRNVMCAAFAVSSIFLASYLWYHTHYRSGRFPGVGWIRPVYFSILISHIVLAVVITPLALRLLWLGFHQAFQKHRRLGKIVWPLWMYTSITGVVIYLMLYHYPHS